MKQHYVLENISYIASQIISEANHKILLFYGEMGVGKTTLIKEIAKQLGVSETIKSPTYSLVNEYHTKDKNTIFHFDFYRIKNEEEAYDIGIEDYFYSNSWCFIEWPENIENLLPLEAVTIKITKNKEQQQRTLALSNS